MQVTVEDINSVKKILRVEIPAERVHQQIEDAYREIKKSAKIKGFRKGKAPRSVLERLFKKEVQADVTQRLIQETFVDALKEADLNIVGSPKIDPSSLSAQTPFQYHATVEIRPRIGTIDFKGLKLKKKIYRVSDAEVETHLKMLQKNMAQLKTLDTDRPAQEGDSVLIDYEGYQGGKLFPEIGNAENFALQIGKKTIAPEIDRQLVGMRPGEAKSVTVEFPEDHFNKALAGQKVDFEIRLKEIREEILPAIDDELAKDLGDYESLEALKAKIVENLQGSYDKRTEQELNEQVFRALLDKTDFEVPESLVEAELEGILSDVQRSFENQNKTLEEAGLSKEILAERYRETAEKQVKRYLILEQIIEQAALSLSDEELDSEMVKMAQAVNQPVDQIKRYYRENPDRLEFLKHGLLEKKAMALILDHSRIEEIGQDEQAEDAKEATSTEATKKE